MNTKYRTNLVTKWYFKDQIDTFETLGTNLIKWWYFNFKDRFCNVLFYLFLCFCFNNLIIVIIFCEQAAYFVSQGFRRKDKRTNMLLVCLSLFYFSIPMFAIKLANQEKKKVLLEKKNVARMQSGWTSHTNQSCSFLTLKKIG
jgi:hypothetical protein